MFCLAQSLFVFLFLFVFSCRHRRRRLVQIKSTSNDDHDHRPDRPFKLKLPPPLCVSAATSGAQVPKDSAGVGVDGGKQSEQSRPSKLNFNQRLPDNGS